jgi:hypothetical protein
MNIGYQEKYHEEESNAGPFPQTQEIEFQRETASEKKKNEINSRSKFGLNPVWIIKSKEIITGCHARKGEGDKWSKNEFLK